MAPSASRWTASATFLAEFTLRSVLPNEALARADVVYQTRTQKERHTTGKEPAHKPVKDKHFVIGQKELGILKQDAIIMHPLPRVSEIETIVDADPRAAYFRQAENGLYVRMALLDALADGHGQ